jgi:serine protease AprX
MREKVFAGLFIAVLISFNICFASEPISDINAKVAQLDVNTANLDKIISIFGEPGKYLWGDKTFQRQNLPQVYIARYPDGFSIVMGNGHIVELRFEQPGFVFHDKIKIGSSLEEVLQFIGQPTETVVNQKNEFKDGVLYKDIDGRKGFCYYNRTDLNVMFFFSDYKVSAIYMAPGLRKQTGDTSPKQKPPVPAKKLDSVKIFDDVRDSDLTKQNLAGRCNIIKTLKFNKHTIWPASNKMPAACDPNQLMTDAMNPGLGVRELHNQGITGKGVNVAIIDQPLIGEHPEYKGKIKAYYDTGCDAEKSSMHGPAVTSLLVGTNCGTAPDARVYYAAAPMWKKDSAYFAKALDWILEQNEKLPPGEKIRVVSVSAAPSGSSTPCEKNIRMWDDAYVRAEAAGILVLDCTEHHGFIDRCWYNLKNPDNLAECTPGYRLGETWFDPKAILTPASVRTVAEEKDNGNCGYIYFGYGGTSWTRPYCAGVLAMGWQVNPNLTGPQMRELLFKSAYVKNNAKIINPKEFIRLVKNFKSP